MIAPSCSVTSYVSDSSSRRGASSVRCGTTPAAPATGYARAYGVAALLLVAASAVAAALLPRKRPDRAPRQSARSTAVSSDG